MRKMQKLSGRQKGTAMTWLVSLFFIFIMVALVVDASMLYHDKRKLQSVANALASALANKPQTCSIVNLGNAADILSDAKQAKDAGLFENDSVMARFSDEVEVDEARLVSIDGDGRVYNLHDGPLLGSQSNGVSVMVSREDGLGVLYFFFGEKITASASVRKELVVGISIESNIASIDSSKSGLLSAVFSGILGTELSLSVGGLTTLAHSVTDLGKVVSGIGLDSVTKALSTAELLETVLEVTPGLTKEATDALDEIIGAAVDTNLVLSNVISGIGGSSAPEGAKVPTLALVSSMLMSIDELPNPVSIDLSLLPGLTELKVDLYLDPEPGFILSSARMQGDGYWPRASSRNMRVSVNAGLKLLLVPLININLDLKLATAEIKLGATSCARGSSNLVNVRVDTISSSLATLEADATLVGFVPVARFEPQGTDKPPLESNFFRDVDIGNYNNRDIEDKLSYPIGSNEVLGPLLEDLIESGQLLGVPLVGLSAITDPIAEIVDGILGPLLDALGVSLVPGKVRIESLNQRSLIMEEGGW